MSEGPAIGDYVTLKDSPEVGGTVVRMTESTVTFQTAYNEARTESIEDVDVKSAGISAAFSGLGPNAAEILQNAVGMSVVTRAYDKKFWNDSVMAFVVEDIALEVLFKRYFEQYGVRIFSEISWPLTELEMGSYIPSAKEAKASLNKTAQLTLLDILWRLYKKQPQLDKSRLVNVIKVFAACMIGNFGEKLMTKQTTTYQPR